MSDLNGFWNLYVMVIVAVGIIACIALLLVQTKAKFTPGKTMGHVWDGTLEEYNNPMPRWWVWLFSLTVAFAIVYLVLYPGFGNMQGQLGWTSAGQHQAEVDEMNARIKPTFDAYLKTDIKTLATNREAMETGKRLFQTYCMQCHGANATGSKGFPNLTDADWLYGGEPDDIKETIANGRMGVMTAMGEALSTQDIDDLANYVRSLSNLSHDATSAGRGKELFVGAGTCFTCHGENATGRLPDGTLIGLGAPNLTDNIWLYGSSVNEIKNGIINGRTNRMPAWGEFLGADKVHILTAYVYSLSAH